MSDQDAPRVVVTENGPYEVTGLPLVGKRPVTTERGEPIAWAKTAPLRTAATYSLCRCGQSSRKPFCDSSHVASGFCATDDANASGNDRKPYPGTGVTVRDDRSLCTHAGFCGNAMTNVWKMMRDTADTAVREQVVAMVERCPSGALSYEIDGELLEPDLPPQACVIDDGPLWITGGVPISLADGTELGMRNRVTLCRCGQSSRKPFCDGSHKDAGFTHRVT